MVFDGLVTKEAQITQRARNDLKWLRSNYPDEYKDIAPYLSDSNIESDN